MGCSVSRQLEVAVAEEVTEPLFLDGSRKPRHPSSHKKEPVIIIPRSSERTSDALNKSDDVYQSKEIQEAPTEEGEGAEDAANEATALVPLSWTKTACCGKQCQISASMYCCEHDLTRPVAHYCQSCRERYQDWQEANQAFEDILQELEQTQQTSSGSSSSSDSSSTGTQSGTSGGSGALDDSSSALFEEDMNYQETCPVYDPFSCSSRTVPYLPYGHSDRHSPTDSRTPTGQESPLKDGSVCSFKSVPLEEPNLETQTGRYEVMHSPSKTIPSTAAKQAWTTSVRRYLYLSRGSAAVSSLSLGESETGSMHSLF